MAKVRIINEVIRVTSELKLEDIQKLEKYNPGVLTLKEGKDGETPVFRVCTRKGYSTIDANGAVFDAEKEADKPATIVLVYTGDGDIKEYVKDALGVALVRLNKLEALVPAALEGVNADRAALDAMIEVIE